MRAGWRRGQPRDLQRRRIAGPGAGPPGDVTTERADGTAHVHVEGARAQRAVGGPAASTRVRGLPSLDRSVRAAWSGVWIYLQRSPFECPARHRVMHAPSARELGQVSVAVEEGASLGTGHRVGPGTPRSANGDSDGPAAMASLGQAGLRGGCVGDDAVAEGTVSDAGAPAGRSRVIHRVCGQPCARSVLWFRNWLGPVAVPLDWPIVDQRDRGPRSVAKSRPDPPPGQRGADRRAGQCRDPRHRRPAPGGVNLRGLTCLRRCAALADLPDQGRQEVPMPGQVRLDRPPVGFKGGAVGIPPVPGRKRPERPPGAA